MDQYGADPVRWYLVSTSNPWLPTKFDLDALGEVVRKYFDTLRNTYSFFALYANIDRIVERAEEAGMTVEAFLSRPSRRTELIRPLDRVQIQQPRQRRDRTV